MFPDQEPEHPNDPETSPRTAAELRDAPRISYAEIANGAREVLIEHNGQTYRLRLTRNGRLILSK